MPVPLIAELARAIASDTTEAWLAGAPEALRPRLRRMLAIDRRVSSQFPDSPASCLLARSFGDPALAELHAAWTRELEAGGAPWIRPLQALPVADGLLAELHAGAGLSFEGLDVPRFTSDTELVLSARYVHPSYQGSELRRAEHLRWAWQRGEVVLEPDANSAAPARAEGFPRLETSGWGPAYLVHAPGAARVTLPCPEEASADARFTPDGTRLLVYGTLDEYEGGFVWVVHPETLAIERRLGTGSPVRSLQVHDLDRMLVSTYRSGTIAWIDQQAHVLPALEGELCLSPDGATVASFKNGLRVWSLAELVRASGPAREAGLPARFDPSGARLICGRQLLDGHSGAPIATLELGLGSYLEGGPAKPWLHFGTQALVCSHGGLHVWDSRRGTALPMKEELSYPHWYSLAYDRTGTHLAVLQQGHAKVALYKLPEGRPVRELTFELAGTVLAMSPDGERVAVQHGSSVEVRTNAGWLLGRFGGAAPEKPERLLHGEQTPRFSHDGRRVARFVEGDGWGVASLDHDGEDVRLSRCAALAELPDFADPLPRDWELEVSTLTVFTHRPSGARIALPVAGRWVHNPADPRLAACDDLLVELRAP